MADSEAETQALRMQFAQQSVQPVRSEVAEVLTFWFGEPACDIGALFSKVQRWYQGGSALDEQIRVRFGTQIERALDGRLGDWSSTLEGTLALVLLLDQFTRNVFRDTPRAYAGDAAALALALGVLDSARYATLNLEQRLFIVMPLVHAEDLACQTRAVALAADMVVAAPAPLREAWQIGYERTQKYRAVIARFGRFPHRNAILGRASTPEEEAFLREPNPAPVLTVQTAR